MTKVLLINPPRKIYPQAMDHGTYIPIGLLSIAAVIRNICQVKILDCLIKSCTTHKTKNYILHGTPTQSIKKLIEDFNPDIIGITIPFSTQSETAKAICRISKKIKPDSVVVFGGPHASARYRNLLKETDCDFCVIGEGEETFFEFVRKFSLKQPLSNIAGLAYKTANKIHYRPRGFIEDLDKLPFPAYDLINVPAYLNDRYRYRRRKNLKNSIVVITSRGCPYNCVFCSIKLTMGRNFRFHSPDYVLRHLRFLIKDYGVNYFRFEDDNIALNKRRFEQILDKIIASRLKIKWDVRNGMRADTLDLNLLKKIKKSGCQELRIGIESANQDILNKVIKKNISLDYILKIVKYCQKLKIKIGAYYVIGFPEETIENMQETVNLALKLYRRYTVFPYLLNATPLYGTELYKTCIKNRFIKANFTDKDFAEASQILGTPLISTKDFTREDVKKLSGNFALNLYSQSEIPSSK